MPDAIDWNDRALFVALADGIDDACRAVQLSEKEREAVFWIAFDGVTTLEPELGAEQRVRVAGVIAQTLRMAMRWVAARGPSSESTRKTPI